MTTSPQCRRGHHDSCRSRSCECPHHDGGTVPATPPVRPSPVTEPGAAATPRKRRAARPPGPRPKVDPAPAVTPDARQAHRLPPVPPGHRVELDATPDRVEFVRSLSSSEIVARLTQRGLKPGVIEALIHDRETAGGMWRLIQELCR